MTDQHQELLSKISDLRRLVDEATLGPWRYESSRETWTLHGEAREFKGKAKGGSPGMQILKAPKTGTQYAEYWPTLADGELLVTAVNMFPFWLDWASGVLYRHFPTPCSCRGMHFLCAVDRQWTWEKCPEISGLILALDGMHLGQV